MVDQNKFVHLHVHSEYSLLDGAARVKDLVHRAVALDMPALAITDHGVMYGVVDFYGKAVEAGVKPVLGCEVYTAPRSRLDREPRKDDHQHHLVLLAENREGYLNLMHLVSAGFLEGFYYKPRIDREILSRHSGGLIALSGCLAGEIPSLFLRGESEKARDTACYYRDLFGRENFYLELHDHGLPEQKNVNRFLFELGRREGIPLVATNDVHYLQRSDAVVHDVILCIQTGKTVMEEKRLRFESPEFYFKSGTEMAQLFGEIPEALSNTVLIADRCRVDFDFKTYYLPDYELPPGTTAEEYLSCLCYEGLAQRYPVPTKAMRERLEYELSVINKMDYACYFLIVWDLIRYARRREILVGPGRGSAAGSLVSYCLGITNIDPLRYGLLFERFLNPERISMPDIDIDFCDDQRDQILHYVVEKYGADRVAQIITFGTMAARAAVRDVGRALGVPYGEVDRIAKLIPLEVGMTIDKALDQNRELKAMYSEERYRRLLETSIAVEGLPRHASVHAAGVVIAREPLVKHVPLQKTGDGQVVTQFTMDILEKLGLLKMDFLGLKTLSIIDKTISSINRRHGISLEIDRIPIDDAATYRLLSRGDTAGIFQLESPGMRGALKELQPGRFEDIIAVVALYRPGPMEQIPAFINSKHGREPIHYLHPALEPVLKETYGVIVYQEQIMEIASRLAGFTLSQADLLRRAIGKKQKGILDRQRRLFVEGCLANGYERSLAEEIYALILKFASYGFNKSHAAAYALVAYQTAFLKANYPVEYMAALMTVYYANSDKVALYIADCRFRDMDVLPPDVNESESDFTVVSDDRIRFGLTAVKNVGLGAIDSIMATRQERPFTSLRDFTTRVDSRLCNRKVVESLIKSGAFDSLGGSRAQYLGCLEEAITFGQASQREKENGQISMFSLMAPSDRESVMTDRLPGIPEFSPKERLDLEKEMLGLYISGHPLDQYRFLLERMPRLTRCAELAEAADGSEATVGGIVKTIQSIYTKKGRPMAFVVLEDLTGSVEIVVFPDLYTKEEQYFQEDNLLVIGGKIDAREEKSPKILAKTVTPLPREPKQLFIRVGPSCGLETLAGVKKILAGWPGGIPVYLYFDAEKKMLLLDEGVRDDPEVSRSLEKLLGAGAVKLQNMNAGYYKPDPGSVGNA